MKFSGILRIAFALLTLILLSTWIGFNRLDSQVNVDLKLSEKAFEVHEGFVSITKAIQRSIKSQQSFLLTKDQQFLERYHQTIKILPGRIERLQVAIESPTTPPKIKEASSAALKGITAHWVELHRLLMRSIERGANDESHSPLTTIRENRIEQLDIEISTIGREMRNQLAQISKDSKTNLRESSAKLRAMLWLLLASLFLSGLVILMLHNRRVREPLSAITNWLEKHQNKQTLPPLDQNAPDPEINAVRQALIHFRNELERNTQEKLDFMQKQLDKQIEFTSVLAHELRTPLTTVVGMLAIHKSTDPLGQEHRILEQIEHGATDLLEIVNTTLDFQKMKEGAYQIVDEALEADNFLSSIIEKEKVSPLAKYLCFNVKNSIPENTLLLADANKIRRAVSNLISNAIKFTPRDGTIGLESSLVLKDGCHYWKIDITDTGIGMEASKLASIFEPFKQLDEGARRQFSGTGLGLALTQEITKALGGHLSVRSELGKGTTFSLELPIKMITNSADITACGFEKNDFQDLRVDLQNHTILLVEDHALNAKINCKILQNCTQCRAVWAESAEASFDLIKQGQQFDLILMDINLGQGMTGLEATVFLRGLLADNCPPIVALTAGLPASQMNLALDVGMVGFLEKPLLKENLNKILVNLFPDKVRDQNDTLLPATSPQIIA